MSEGLTVVEKLVVIPVWAAPQKVSKIDWKLPAHIRQCTGVAFTISAVQGVCNVIRMGEVGLLFNNRCTHPLNFEVQQKDRHFRLDTLTMTLDVPIRSASRVSGFYRNMTDNEHILKVYLQCLAETEV